MTKHAYPWSGRTTILAQPLRAPRLSTTPPAGERPSCATNSGRCRQAARSRMTSQSLARKDSEIVSLGAFEVGTERRGGVSPIMGPPESGLSHIGKAAAVVASLQRLPIQVAPRRSMPLANPEALTTVGDAGIGGRPPKAPLLAVTRLKQPSTQRTTFHPRSSWGPGGQVEERAIVGFNDLVGLGSDASVMTRRRRGLSGHDPSRTGSCGV
jgi:hypothetical protein